MTYPKWVSESYKGAEEDFTDWIRTVAKETMFAEVLRLAKNDPGAEAQADAMVEHWVMSRTKELTKTTERAFVFQLFEADRKGWYHHLPGELDTIEELLGTMIDEMEESSSKYFDYKFIIDTVMPILRQVGAKPEDVWGLTTSVSKARAAVPVFRELLRTIPDDGPPSQETTEAILNIAQQISDPSVSFRPFKEEMKKQRGISTNVLSPIPVEKFFMPGDEQWFLIKAPASHTRMVEIGLKGIASQIDVRDAWSLILTLAELIKKPMPKNGKGTPQELENLLVRE
jgi:hypothetical protein